MTGAHVVVSEQDSGKVVALGVGQMLTVRLAENASTGYRWTIDRFDAFVLRAAGSHADYPARRVGAGGEVAFDFEARNPGSAEIHLKNWRSWEGDVSVISRFDLWVKVQG